MADSPTRRSSIPILKQTNKTKSFQSFVSLHLTDDVNQLQKSRSPPSLSSVSSVIESPKLPPQPLARPFEKVAHLEIDNDIVITKLCDENKRLKEQQTQLVSKYEEGESKMNWGFLVMSQCLNNAFLIFPSSSSSSSKLCEKIWKFKIKMMRCTKSFLERDEKLPKRFICKEQLRSRLRHLF